MSPPNATAPDVTDNNDIVDDSVEYHAHHHPPHQLAVDHPPPLIKSMAQLIIFHGLMPLFLPILAPAAITYKCLTDHSFRITFPPASFKLYSLVNSATISPISKQWYYQHPSLLKQLWKLASARAYIDNSTGMPLVEYQMQEGYCGSATQRCILRSLGFSNTILPPQQRGESKPIPWCTHITQIANESSNGTITLSTQIVEGNVSYDEFVSKLRNGLSNPNVRIACNFLRSVLMGFEKIRYIPINLMFSLMGGHFSPIIGMIDQPQPEDDSTTSTTIPEEVGDDYPLVAIFDTNHKYNGVYFVPARRLYEAVNTVDLFNNSHRAIILVEKNETQ
ncbi:hypothetical protein ACHAXH_002089 [Discostella pseudostelligera]